jgi:uncharacterized protein (TIGR01777 family)
MNFFITGGSGFVGTNLILDLIGKGHDVVATGTSSTHPSINHDSFHYISADTTQKGDWQRELQKIDVLINLAGRNIFKLWSKNYKDQIYSSRILTTRNLVEAIPKNNKITFFNASAAGYYGNRADEILSENSMPGNDFLAKVCIDWEREAFQAEVKGIRVVAMRFGIVLGKNGGALEKMLPVFKWFVGGPLGNGEQWFPWIHMADLISAISFILEKPDIKGPLNICAPDSIRQKDFAKTLGSTLNRPAFMRIPAFFIRLLMGELGRSLISSQRASPDRLVKHGFEFQYPDINAALCDII